MVKTRQTTQDEVDRLAESVFRKYKGRFDSLEDFNDKFTRFFDGPLTKSQDTELRGDVLNILKFRNRNLANSLIESKKKKLFKRARGKDLVKDRQKTAKRVVTNVKDYVRIGAQKSDLAGFDTAKRFGWLKGGRRRQIARQTVVTYPKTYLRKLNTGKIITVKRKVREEIRLYSKDGRRLSMKRRTNRR